ncbi:hypothetical protein G6011_02951 [Alternaria panax]|uniref:Uncharacterized protein n=1 Tax=Alternaria panax TaxID=48097 RepID=A0AAD4FBI4_9PLEO|nr:hypothetical protein G6011_02951 [Alternaria panax]
MLYNKEIPKKVRRISPGRAELRTKQNQHNSLFFRLIPGEIRNRVYMFAFIFLVVGWASSDVSK